MTTRAWMAGYVSVFEKLGQFATQVAMPTMNTPDAVFPPEPKPTPPPLPLKDAILRGVRAYLDPIYQGEIIGNALAEQYAKRTIPTYPGSEQQMRNVQMTRSPTPGPTTQAISEAVGKWMYPPDHRQEHAMYPALPIM